MSTIAAIPRMKFGDIDAALDSRVQLANKAASQLGYNKLAKTYTEPESLLYSLRELDITPLDMSAVDRYKASKEKIGLWHSTILVYRYLAAASIFAAAAVALLQFVPHPAPLHWAAFAGCAIGTFLCLGNAGTNSGEAHRSGNYRKITEWQRVRLDTYQGIVPLYILHKALEIKQKVPTADFFVDQLVVSQDHGTLVRNPDPFIIVYDRRDTVNQYYFDVWDERDFENQML